MNHQSPEPVLGVRDPLPLLGFPAGRVRLRMRSQHFARAYVKTSTGLRCYIVGELEGHWVPLAECEEGRNMTVPHLPAGALMIAAERARQISEEGWTAEHDDVHDGAELAAAAGCYLAIGETMARTGDSLPPSRPKSPPCAALCATSKPDP